MFGIPLDALELFPNFPIPIFNYFQWSSNWESQLSLSMHSESTYRRISEYTLINLACTCNLVWRSFISKSDEMIIGRMTDHLHISRQTTPSWVGRFYGDCYPMKCHSWRLPHGSEKERVKITRRDEGKLISSNRQMKIKINLNHCTW